MATDEISGCVRGVRAPVVCDTGARTVLSGFPAGWEPPGWVTANSTSPVSRATSGQLRIGQAHRISIATTADTPPQVDHTPKCSWIWRTAIDPSPTADATLFTEPLRTSPAANTPGWLVSSIPGWRWGQRPRVDRLALALHHLPGLSAARRATRPRSCHRLGPLDLPFKSKRYRHGSVAVPVVSRGGFIAVGSSQQRAQP